MTKKENLHIFPSLVCLLAPTTFLITFAVAVKLGHVSTILPYISDTGNHMPESCIFSQFLNMTAFLLLICVYIRYLQIESLATFKTPIGPRLSYNAISWYTGFLACLGMGIVANFQVENIYQVHYVGALLSFVGGSFYFSFQTIFSYHLSKLDNSRYLFYTRCALCVLSACLCVLAIAYGITSSAEYHGNNSSHWSWSDGGYVLHVVSSSSEWLLAFCQCALVLTFMPEFKRISIYSPKFEIRGIHDVDLERPEPQSGEIV
ncbi:Frag1/DRAM/Sfk1 family [Nesidiocoris tenuis]|uniref:Frag1/DRAM/Sfk1 family n=1 Tax=Nesidiocoris tenuis TaxID=355587 RepID=A0ABN7ANK3_9HEMI|nr:Frag1/DRAM/Sfk1 family [Nesidiocoris tenuis]